MFSRLVAFRAQGNEIGERIRLLVVVVFALYVTKSTEWLNMVNVEESLALLVFMSTVAACVFVALASIALLGVPVWAIVGLVSAAPAGMIVAYHVLGLPLPHTISVTKKVFSLGNLPRLSLQFSSTSRTSDNYALLPRWMRYPDNIFRTPLTAALFATKEVFALINKVTLARDFIATVCTLSIHAAIRRILLAYQSALVGGMTFWAANRVCAFPRMGWVPFHFLTTNRTLDNAVLCGSTKKTSLVRSIAIHVAEAVFVLFRLGWFALKHFAAMGAWHADPLVVSILFPGERALVRGVTRHVAKVILTAASMCRRAQNNFSAMGAVNFNPFVIFVCRANKRALPSRQALPITKLSGIVFQSRRLTLKFLTTVETINFDFLGTWHNETLLTKGWANRIASGKVRCQWPNFSEWFMRPFLSLPNYTTGGDQ